MNGLCYSAALAARADVVTSQGLLVPEVVSGQIHSPDGQFRADISELRDNGGNLNRIEVRQGAELIASLEFIRGNGFLLAGRDRLIVVDAPDTNTLPARVVVSSFLGQELLVRDVENLVNPRLTADGSILLLQGRTGVEAIDMATLSSTVYPPALLADVGSSGRAAFVTGDPFALLIHRPDGSQQRQPLDHVPRRLALSSDACDVLLLYAGYLDAINVETGTRRRVFDSPHGVDFRDMIVANGEIQIGGRCQSDNGVRGMCFWLNNRGGFTRSQTGPAAEIKNRPWIGSGDRGIPWPFLPDEQHPVGNSYGCFQTFSGAPYMHPGIDILEPAFTAVYAVRGGVVKAILTTSGEYHWRIAIGDAGGSAQTPGYLYAHMTYGSIAVDVGDEVSVGQYLGTIIDFPYDFAHLHFARIRASGSVWSGNWECIENPHLRFNQLADFTPPVFQKARGNDWFAFCGNETSSYQSANALTGEVDIIARVMDTAASSYSIGVQEIRYSIYPFGYPETPIVDNKLSSFFDMWLDTYGSSSYSDLLCDLMYQQDSTCSSVFDWYQRNLYYIVTNSDGDIVFDEDDFDQSWDTAATGDGMYVIEITARDAAGNSAVKSMVVTTANGIDPTPRPTVTPEMTATMAPTPLPTLSPTPPPTVPPTALPTEVPTIEPTGWPNTVTPTAAPTWPPEPTTTPDPQATATPTATMSLTPTATVTWTATGAPTATATPEPSATPALSLGVRLHLPTEAHPGEVFFVDGYLDNPDSALVRVPVFFVLEVIGEFWFWPHWIYYDPTASAEIDWLAMNVPQGTTHVTVIGAFTWPDTGQETVSGLRFYGAMLNQDLTGFLGQLAVADWSYGPDA